MDPSVPDMLEEMKPHTRQTWMGSMKVMCKNKDLLMRERIFVGHLTRASQEYKMIFLASI